MKDLYKMLFRSCLNLFNNRAFWPGSLRVWGFTKPQLYSKSVETGPDVKLRPKRPKNAWVYYVKDHSSAVAERYPAMSRIEVYKTLAAEWKNAAESDRERYHKLAMSGKAKYDEELAEYEASLTPSEKLAERIKQEGRARAYRKIFREYGKPKKPSSGYVRFALEYATNNFGGPKGIFKNGAFLSSLWANLPEAEKLKYNKEAAVDIGEWEVQLQEWQCQMIAQGHEKLLADSKNKTKKVNVSFKTRLN